MQVTLYVSYKEQELLTIPEHLGSSCFFQFCFRDFCFVCLRSESCVHSCLCLWIVHYWLPLRFSLTFIHIKTYLEYIIGPQPPLHNLISNCNTDINKLPAQIRSHPKGPHNRTNRDSGQ